MFDKKKGRGMVLINQESRFFFSHLINININSTRSGGRK
jgi:hypothetical protein